MSLTQDVRIPQLAAQWPFKAQDFVRMDESSDKAFYRYDRFVTHIDDRCIETLSKYYGAVLPSPSTQHKPCIIDLASSWISHLPDTFSKATANVLGIGMNKNELEANPILSKFQINDLNENPSFQDVADATQDAVICSVSIDYLTKPRSIMGEIARVLKPGCWAHMAFSNRCFHTKVVGRWLRLTDEERCDMIAQYFAFSGNEDTTQPSNHFQDIEIVTLLKPSWSGDPLYVVRAKKVNSKDQSHGEL